MKAKILYAEDDDTLSFITKDSLELKGYDITHCNNGLEAKDAFEEADFDLAILDVMMPKMDGFTLAQEIRERNYDIPILFLTAKSLKEDRIKGLEIGGDDYITKPFSLEELVLKIEVFLKRRKITNHQTQASYDIGDYFFDKASQQLKHTKSEEIRKLTLREAELLEEFAKKPNRIIDRSEILIKLWGEDDYFKSRSLDVFVSRLRKYLQKDKNLSIENIHSVGFRFNTKS